MIDHGRAPSGQALVSDGAQLHGLLPAGFDPSRIAELIAEGDGFWRTCSGCYETCDGYPDGHYPHSEVFGCTLGGGCGDCGGIGAIWDDTDWSDFADYSLEQDQIQKSRRAELSRLANSICHVLSQKLQHRTTGRDPKLNGYTYADVPEWLLRQWLERVTNVDRSLANASAIEAPSGVETGNTDSTEGESAVPKADAQPLAPVHKKEDK